MEKEKLAEGKKTFQEDKDKYDKFRNDLASKALETEDKVKLVNKEIEVLLCKINQLRKEYSLLQSQESKC